MKQIDRDYHLLVMELFAKWQKVHHEFLQEMHRVKDLNELADMVYVIRKIADMLEEMSSKAKGAYDLNARLLCLLWAQHGDHEPVRTDHCTVTPKIKMSASLPKKGTEEYKNLLKNYFKIPENLIEIDAVRPHWPGVTDLITELATRGASLPEGIDPSKTYHTYSVLIKAKKAIQE